MGTDGPSIDAALLAGDTEREKGGCGEGDQCIEKVIKMSTFTSFFLFFDLDENLDVLCMTFCIQLYLFHPVV